MHAMKPLLFRTAYDSSDIDEEDLSEWVPTERRGPKHKKVQAKAKKQRNVIRSRKDDLQMSVSTVKMSPSMHAVDAAKGVIWNSFLDRTWSLSGASISSIFCLGDWLRPPTEGDRLEREHCIFHRLMRSRLWHSSSHAMSLDPEFASARVKWLDFGSVENILGFRYLKGYKIRYDRTQWCQRSQFWRSGSCPLAMIMQYDGNHLFLCAFVTTVLIIYIYSLLLWKLNTRHFALFCFMSEEQQARASPLMFVSRILLKKTPDRLVHNTERDWEVLILVPWRKDWGVVWLNAWPVWGREHNSSNQRKRNSEVKKIEPGI